MGSRERKLPTTFRVVRTHSLSGLPKWYTGRTYEVRLRSRKSRSLAANPKRGIGFEEVQQIFDLPYYNDQRSDFPEQFRAIGWVNGNLYSVVYEVREDAEGEFCWLVTLWKATEEERQLYVQHA